MNAITTRRAMKSSGVDWIGDIPVNWEVKRIKSIFNISRGRVIAFSDVQPFGMYPVYSSQTLNFGILGYISSYDYEGAMLTWTTDGANAGTVFLRCGQFNCTNVCGILQLKLKLHYSLALLNYSVSHATEFYKRPDTNGAKIMSNEMARICIVIPPLSEQILIAQYLDSRTQIIDAKIQLLQDKSTALFELRKSVIHQAVTKGLDPGVPMKTSGVDWIGDIPVDWEVKRAGQNFYECQGRGSSNEIVLTCSIEYGVLPQKDYSEITKRKLSTPESEKENYKRVYKGDYVYNKMRMWQGAISKSEYAGVVSPAYIVMRTSGNNDSSSFYKWVLRSNYVITQSGSKSYGICDDQNSLRFSDFKTLLILTPPLSEQILIAQYLDARTSIIDESIATIKEQIDALKALRQSLIHEAVTGKVDVTTLKVIAPCLQENLPNPT